MAMDDGLGKCEGTVELEIAEGETIEASHEEMETVERREVNTNLVELGVEP
jgi:hypothetical protein